MYIYPISNSNHVNGNIMIGMFGCFTHWDVYLKLITSYNL